MLEEEFREASEKVWECGGVRVYQGTLPHETIPFCAAFAATRARALPFLSSGLEVLHYVGKQFL